MWAASCFDVAHGVRGLVICPEGNTDHDGDAALRPQGVQKLWKWCQVRLESTN